MSAPRFRISLEDPACVECGSTRESVSCEAEILAIDPDVAICCETIFPSDGVAQLAALVAPLPPSTLLRVIVTGGRS